MKFYKYNLFPTITPYETTHVVSERVVAMLIFSNKAVRNFYKLCNLDCKIYTYKKKLGKSLFSRKKSFKDNANKTLNFIKQ